MNKPDDIMTSMVKEAMEEVGNQGWKRANGKAVTLAAFGMLAHRVDKKIDRLVKPAWIICLSVAGSAIWFIISEIIGG